MTERNACALGSARQRYCSFFYSVCHDYLVGLVSGLILVPIPLLVRGTALLLTGHVDTLGEGSTKSPLSMNCNAIVYQIFLM